MTRKSVKLCLSGTPMYIAVSSAPPAPPIHAGGLYEHDSPVADLVRCRRRLGAGHAVRLPDVRARGRSDAAVGSLSGTSASVYSQIAAVPVAARVSPARGSGCRAAGRRITAAAASAA